MRTYLPTLHGARGAQKHVFRTLTFVTSLSEDGKHTSEQLSPREAEKHTTELQFHQGVSRELRFHFLKPFLSGHVQYPGDPQCSCRGALPWTGRLLQGWMRPAGARIPTSALVSMTGPIARRRSRLSETGSSPQMADPQVKSLGAVTCTPCMDR